MSYKTPSYPICGSFDSSGIDARQNIITTDIHISPYTCKHAAERGYVNLGYSKNIPFHFDEKKLSRIQIEAKLMANTTTNAAIVLGSIWILSNHTCKIFP